MGITFPLKVPYKKNYKKLLKIFLVFSLFYDLIIYKFFKEIRPFCLKGRQYYCGTLVVEVFSRKGGDNGLFITLVPKVLK